VQEWEARIERFQSKSEWKGEEGRWRRRRIFGAVTPTTLDEKGRFTIPKDLLESVGIGRQCLILGVERSIEIWDPDRYFELERQHQTDLSDVEDILF